MQSTYGRLAIGLMLVAAAALKSVHPEGISRVSGISGALTLVVAELFLGLWLCAGVAATASSLTGGVLFTIFAVVSAHRGLSGERACGCFGSVQVNPWLMAGIDGAAALFLVRTCRSRGDSPGARRIWGAVAIWSALSLFCSGILLSRWPARLGGDGANADMARSVVLEPETWVGQRCPLLKSIDIGHELGRSRWVAVLYHHDCERCQHAIRTLRERVIEDDPPVHQRRVALIEVPPCEDGAIIVDVLAPRVVHGRLSGSSAWFVATPVELLLDEGVVTAVSGASSLRQ